MPTDQKYLTYDEAEEKLVEALDNESYAVFEGEDFVEDGTIYGYVITSDGHVITFATDPEWGPYRESATSQGHVESEGNEDWLAKYNEATNADEG